MAKGREKQIRERLDKAKSRLGQLQGALVATESRGEEKLRLARERLERRLSRSRKRVEQQVRRVAQREAKLTELKAPKASNGEVVSPSAAAEVLSQAATEKQASTREVSPVPGSDASFEVPLVQETKVVENGPSDEARDL
jgi:DNA repair exonuclease SbcCD ATPase subunit